MVKHIIIWTLKEGYTEQEKEEIKNAIKEGLEDLKGKIEGLLDVHVQIELLDTSSADILLDSTLESFEALKAYAVNPLHVRVAKEKIIPFVQIRSCIDYEIQK